MQIHYFRKITDFAKFISKEGMGLVFFNYILWSCRQFLPGIVIFNAVY
jgi:hypothetical protein